MSNIRTWNLWHAITMVSGGILIVYFKSPIPIILLASLSFTLLWKGQLPKLRTISPFAGYANWLTLFRFILLIQLSLLNLPTHRWSILVIALSFLLLDGMDGYLARKFQQETKLGAYFDMETDTIYVCIMCSILYLADLIGPWFLMIGFLRYIYVLALTLLGLDQIKEESTYFAKTVAVILFISLLFPLLLPSTLYLPVFFIVFLLVILSFGISFVIIV